MLPKTQTSNLTWPSPWKANSSSASQEIPRILWNPNFHYRVHNSPPVFYNLSHSNTVQTPHPVCLKSSSILPLPSFLYPSCFPNKFFHASLVSPIRAITPTHLVFLDFANSREVTHFYFIVRIKFCINTSRRPLETTEKYCANRRQD